jgi:hypothetical protein
MLLPDPGVHSVFFYSKKQDIQSILFAASGAIFTPIFICPAPPPPNASVLYVYVIEQREGMCLLEYLPYVT